MRYLRFIFGVCALSLVMATTAFAKSLEYRAGKAAAYIDYCGDYDLKRSLNQRYGKFRDYVKGKTENSLKTNSERPDGDTDIDCYQWGVSADKLLNQERRIDTGSVITQADYSATPQENQTVCYMALGQLSGTWSHADDVQSYVRKAKRRGLSVNACARILGRTTTIASAPASSNDKTSAINGLVL